MLTKFILRIVSLYLIFYSVNITYAAVKATFPAQVSAEILQAPTPLVAANKNFLVYEIHLTNYFSEPVTLTTLTVNGNNLDSHPFVYKNTDFSDLIHTIGVKKEPASYPLVFQPGITKIVLMWLPFDKSSDIPSSLIHKIELNGFIKGKDQTFTLTTNPMVIKNIPPIVIGSPLHGSNWIAGSAPSNTSPHRMTGLIVNGHDYFAQRYAIDFIQIDDKGGSFQGDEHKNTSYYCYGQDALAVANGKVVAVQDGVPENIPHHDKLAIELSLQNLPGNNVVIDVGQGRYACYGHLIPGSIKVKVGDQVKRGQVIAKVGNSGNSSEPHLHFHVVDKPSFIAANGTPYAFHRFAIRPIKIIDPEVTKIQFLSDVWQNVSDQLVIDNTLMKFFD